MPEVVREKEMSAPLKAVYAAITDFESYPKFLPEVVGVKILENKGNRVLVEFEIEVMKKFQYSLEFTLLPPTEVKWKLAKSNFFKTNEGKWGLAEVPGEKTHVTYELNLALGFLVPGWVVKKLTAVNLPQMFESYEKRARSIAQEG